MSTSLYRRKPVLTEAHQRSDKTWEVTEAGYTQTYPPEVFAALYETIELQADLGDSTGITDIAGFDLSWCTRVEDRNLFNEFIGLEAVSTDNEIDGSSWMFKPYPISTLGKLIMAVVKHRNYMSHRRLAAPPIFLEIGCGIGAKLVVAAKVFGFHVVGFDYNSHYVQDAHDLLQSRGVLPLVFKMDALNESAVDYYGTADIIYLNRPFVHLDKQAELEKFVTSSMHPGAYIILANYASEPESFIQQGWNLVAKDKLAVVLQKPEVQ